ASLKAIFGKTGGVKVPEWYANGNYNAIEDYIRREAEDFIQFYQILSNRYKFKRVIGAKYEVKFL
ncbi:unnamed protein product, partial [marine sediment metagenome]